jgi:hypothetical protein
VPGNKAAARPEPHDKAQFPFVLETSTEDQRDKIRATAGLPRDGVTLVDPTARLGVQLARILEPELFLDPGSVGLDGRNTHAQSQANLTSGSAFTYQFEDGQLAIGQTLDRSR